MIARNFPSYHPKKGKETFFVEKIMHSLFCTENAKALLSPKEIKVQISNIMRYSFRPKHTTIRATKRFKRGDVINLKVWASRPYHSPQVTFASNVKLSEVYDIRMEKNNDIFDIYIDNQLIYRESIGHLFITAPDYLYRHADMDGLSTIDMLYWFKLDKLNKAKDGVFFDGQVICWSKPIYIKILPDQIIN